MRRRIRSVLAALPQFNVRAAEVEAHRRRLLPFIGSFYLVAACTSSRGMWRFTPTFLSVELQNKALGLGARTSKANPSVCYLCFSEQAGVTHCYLSNFRFFFKKKYIYTYIKVELFVVSGTK